MTVATDFVVTSQKNPLVASEIETRLLPAVEESGLGFGVAHLRKQNVSEGQSATGHFGRDLQGPPGNALTDIDSCAQSAQR